MTFRTRRPSQPSRPAVLQPLETRQLMSVSLPTASPAISLTPLASSSSVVGLTPAQLKTAYGFSSLSFSSGKTAANGTGQTIAIVDAYNDPNIASDLTKFDAQFGLAAASLSVVNETGGTRLPASNTGWAEEISLDVEWAHAVAPGAKILLVESNSASDSDLLAGVNYARSAAGVSVVSLSWGGSEFAGETAYDSYFTTPAGHTGVTFVAASGDQGSAGGVDWPASSPDVLSVGGTTLITTGSSGTYSSETGWADSTGGTSQFEGEPSYQSTVQSTDTRSVPDVSADANPSTGVAVYDSYGTSSAWMEFGGTSAAAPQWAALVAIADQGRVISGLTSLDGATSLLPTIYSLGSSSTTYSADFHDVTSGATSRSISAGKGYDEVTGLGTPKANTLVPALVASTKKVALSVTSVPVAQPPFGYPPPWWLAVTNATAPAQAATTSSAAPVAPATIPPVSVGTLTTTAADVPTVVASDAAATTSATINLSPAATAEAAADPTAGTLAYEIRTTPDSALTAMSHAPLGLVGANILSTAFSSGFSNALTQLESVSGFAAGTAADGWPAGTTPLRLAAESFAQTLAASAGRAAKPVAAALAAAGVLYAVAEKSKKAKPAAPLFSDRAITIA